MTYPNKKVPARRGEQEPVRKRKSPLDLSTMVYGKVPPQAKDLEEAVLGAIMLEPGAIDVVLESIIPECFYVEAHQRIFRSMIRLAQKSNPVDILTVCEELKRTEELEMVGGPYYVTKLTNHVVSAANIEFHTRIILQKFVQREMIRICGELIGDAYEDSTDAFDLLDNAEAALFGVSSSMYRKQVDSVDTLLVKRIQHWEKIRHLPAGLTGAPSGFTVIDKLTHGWQDSDLIILAARPSVGKTAFALNLARNAVLDPIKPTPTAFFSLEMPSAQLIDRIVSSMTEINLNKITRCQLDDEHMKVIYQEAVQKLGQAPLHIDDTPALNIFELRAKLRRLKKKHNIGLAIIDYLQLMTGSGDTSNREQEISGISRQLKSLAKELKIPIIALSQLSRAVEQRGGEKMPQLSDLRDSGAIEQDADVVMFMYRPDYYGIQKNAMGENATGETHFRIAKHRNGELDTVKLRAKLWIQNFVDMEQGFTSKSVTLAPGVTLSGPVQVQKNDDGTLPF